MGKFLNKFKESARSIDKRANNYAQKQQQKPKEFRGGKIIEQNNRNIGGSMYSKEEEFKRKKDNDDNYDDYDDYDDFNDTYDVNIQQAQKPESFHRFVLDNKFGELERSIRGYKDVFNKQTQKWEVKRKEVHCFTDEEAESIVRTAQAHLSADIKLSRMSVDAFGDMMDLIYDEIERLFARIMEYRYGRYNTFDKNGNLLVVNYTLQGKMKDEALKILVELYNSIWANYSRAVGGRENIDTHQSVRGQESLQQTDNSDFNNRGYT